MVPSPIPPNPSQTSGNKGLTQPGVPKVDRNKVGAAIGNTNGDGRVTLDDRSDYEANLLSLLNKDLTVAQHDREMAVALMQVYLDRAEGLDEMALSMPVATVISDNNGSILKSLELSMKAGERIHKAAELLVKAKQADDKILIDVMKQQLAERKLNNQDEGEWGDLGDLPGGG